MKTSEENLASADSRPFDPASLTELGQMILRKCVTPGSTVVDGTVGNGHDTLFLAKLVGPTGQVYGFEVQATALVDTLEKCHQATLAPIPILHHCGHEDMDRHLPGSLRGKIQAFVFNLGYLPGSDKRVISQPETTLRALSTSLDWLAHGGILLVTVYRGHKGGSEESSAISDWARSLPPSLALARQTIALNGSGETPWQLLVYKRPVSDTAPPAKQAKP